MPFAYVHMAMVVSDGGVGGPPLLLAVGYLYLFGSKNFSFQLECSQHHVFPRFHLQGQPLNGLLLREPQHP